MRRSFTGFALAAAAILAFPIAARPAKHVAAPHAAARDWTRIVVATPDGGFRMGNPAAPLKLVEYGSLTCPHCGHFAAEGMPALLQNYVKPGRVSFEFRNFVRDPYDMAAALISRCGGARSFFPLTEQVFRTQDQWTGRFASLTGDQYDAMNAMPELPRLARIASVSGLDLLAAHYGIPPARTKSCVSDPAGVARLTEIKRVAIARFKVDATPTFVINGVKADGAYAWNTLEPRLRPPGR
jgi:protein-disulfide isomerase